MLNIMNLSLEVTRNCNFRCAHCLKGEPENINLDLNVLDKIFKRGVNIKSLQFTGGEVFLVPDVFHKIINHIINSEVMIFQFSIVTNGTCYTKEIEKDLEKLALYINKCNIMLDEEINITPIILELSVDEYHIQQLDHIKDTNKELFDKYWQNIQLFRKSKFFLDERNNKQIFDKGRAKDLDITKYQPVAAKMLYTSGTFWTEKIMEVSAIDIHVDGSIKNTDDNILTKDIEDIIEENGIRCEERDELLKHYEENVYEMTHPKLSVKK